MQEQVDEVPRGSLTLSLLGRQRSGTGDRHDRDRQDLLRRLIIILVSDGTAIYYTWSRQGETSAPLEVIENRFPALFESRRMLYPRYAEFADPTQYEQGIGGFLDHIQRANFLAFADLAASLTGAPTTELERADDDGVLSPITDEHLRGIDTLVMISFDSTRTGQQPSEDELATLRGFLDVPGNVLVVAPHHDIGDEPETEFFHHGDRTIPPVQRFSGFARSLLAELGVPVENRFGLRPAVLPDGQPAPIECQRELDRLGILDDVTSFNLHPHLPHLQRLGAAAEKLEVLARQRIHPDAPPHPFTASGRVTFDALLQSRPGVFRGDLLVCDTTLFSSTAGGVENLNQMWTNLLERPAPTT
jgi:hypothetical protein